MNYRNYSERKIFLYVPVCVFGCCVWGWHLPISLSWVWSSFRLACYLEL